MREILFQGKRTDNGEWVYGYYFAMHHNDDRDHIHQFLIPLDTPLPKNRPIGDIQVEVDPSTVGQYTSLTDRNGKRIFEGDILQDSSPRSLSYKPWIVKRQPITGGYGYWKLDKASTLTVIGNIHDNPELLERGRE